jgi:hypothetical protein
MNYSGPLTLAQVIAILQEKAVFLQNLSAGEQG